MSKFDALVCLLLFISLSLYVISFIFLSALAKNDIELSENINNYDEMKYRNKILDFKKKLGSYEDGHACERVCKLIEYIINGKVQK